jgi:N utilization substance protein B
MATRRDAREMAMHVLFSMDVCKLDRKEAWDSYFRIAEKNDIENIRSFTDELIDGTVANMEVIDLEISKVMTNWDLDRVAATDRAILRLAVFELLFLDTVPINVVINEAVDLAKSFSTPDSGKFVNGVVDKLKDKRGFYERAYTL